MNDKIKVLMLGWEYPPIVNGGLGVACKGLCEALINDGVSIELIVPKSINISDFVVHGVDKYHYNAIASDQSSLPENVYLSPYELGTTQLLKERKNELEISEQGSEKEKSQNQKERFLGLFSSDNVYDQDVMQRVAAYTSYAQEIAKEIDFDVIHAHDWMTYDAGVAIKESTKKPLVLHVHSLDYDRAGGEVIQDYLFEVEKEAFQQADVIVPVSNYTANISQEYYQAPAEKLEPVFNGVEEVQAFTQKKPFDEKLVFFVGRITQQKAPETFLDIATKILEKDKNVRFVMAGHGDLMPKMIAKVAERGLTTNFHFTGHITREKLHHLLSMTDVYCMPSYSEPFGLSALEAAQFGVPMVISAQSGASEILTDACIVDAHDTLLMADKVLELLENTDLARRQGAKLKKKAKGVTWENCAAEIKNIYNDLIY